MQSIKTLVRSRLKYNRSRTILTAVAITFTTILLTALGACTVGLIDVNRQTALQGGNQHAVLSDLTYEQVMLLKNHMDIETVETREIFASIECGKMNGFLTYNNAVKGELFHAVGNLIEGHGAEAADEICGPKAFFQRLGVEPVIGNTVTISFRPGGTGFTESRTFTICGLVSENDADKLDISDSRIAYGANISSALMDEYMPPQERSYRAAIRVYGEDYLNYDEMKERIRDAAEDIGYDTEKIDYNGQYLMTATDPGTEALGIAGCLALIVVLFSGLVIYSIYYVCVITDVQEIGKLSALGASAGQIRQLLLREGLTITMFALPIGLIAGYAISHFAFPAAVRISMEKSVYRFEITHIRMFSLPILLAVAAAVLLTVTFSLLKPIHMASCVSPVEAIRYQEGSEDRRTQRKGYDTVSIRRLCFANLTRNRKRTAVTMTTMGLSCVLFMSLAGVMNSMSPEDIARRNIPKGSFRLSLDFSINDTAYPENNLDNLCQQNLLGEDLLSRIRAIEGVEDIAINRTVLIGAAHEAGALGEGRRSTMGPLTREQAKEYQKTVEQGTIDYDSMIENNGVIFTWDYFMEEEGLSIGDEFTLTVYDGVKEIPLHVQIAASIDEGDTAYFLLPEEIWNRLGLENDTATDLYISSKPAFYESVKEALTQIAEENPYFILYSLDEELAIGISGIALMKYPLYALLLIIAVIGFINLINTMITSIVTRKRELGILQALGLSDRQLVKLLAGEGAVFILGTLLLCVTLGNLLGYLVYLRAKEAQFMSISAWHYPVRETMGLLAALILGQLFITLFISKRVHRESLVERIRSGE